jgi:protein TonB
MWPGSVSFRSGKPGPAVHEPEPAARRARASAWLHRANPASFPPAARSVRPGAVRPGRGGAVREPREHSPAMLGLVFMLSVSLHVFVGLWLQRPAPPFREAKPLTTLEVALVAAAPKPPAAAPAPEPPKPVAAAKPEPVKVRKPPPPRKVEKSVKPLPRKSAEPVRSDPVPARAEAANPGPAPAAAAGPAQAAERETLTEASFHADYLHNPRPAYPREARIRGWEGVVRLRVRVSADGRCEQVEIQRGSGHEALDEAALQAVRQWRFVPARRGDTPVASWAIVPITFTLRR